MRKILIASVTLGLALMGCGNKDADTTGSDTQAPPPGPNANLNPPVKTDKHIPAPPSAGGGPGPATVPGPAAAPGG